MLRFTRPQLRVSAFSLYLKDLSRQGKLAGHKNPQKAASQMYRKLSPVEKEALNKRAARMNYPALDAYNRFQKEYAHRFTYLPNKQRQRKVAALWAELKEKGTVRIPRAPKKAGASKRTSAKRAIKKTAAAKSRKRS